MNMNKKTIAVVGATGLQGTGVVNALIKDGTYKVRAITRNPDSYSGQADEVIAGDLSDVESLRLAFEGAYGVFVVTNFMEGADELAQGKLAVEAAQTAGVEHYVWSTLPNIEVLSNGTFNAPNFTAKANVDEWVKGAGFKYHTFVQAPFYFQNLTGMMSPQPMQDGSVGWALPIDPEKKVIHMADINDLGKVVAGAFLTPEKVGSGSYLSVASELLSFNDILNEFAVNGQSYSFTEVPKDTFASFFDGADVIAATFGYFESYTYMGPGSDEQIQLAKDIATENLQPFATWLKAELAKASATTNA